MHNNIMTFFLITTLGHLTVLDIWKFAALDSAPLFLKPMLAALLISSKTKDKRTGCINIQKHNYVANYISRIY